MKRICPVSASSFPFFFITLQPKSKLTDENREGNIPLSHEELLLSFNRFLNTVDMQEFQSHVKNNNKYH
jgi:hypothetical protein